MLLLALALFAQTADPLAAPELAKPVTFETRAEDATKAVAEIAKLTGTRLSADIGMRSEILVLHLDKVPLNEALKRIALACGASWVKREGWLILERTSEDYRRISKEGKKHFRANLERLFAAERATVESQKPFDEQEARALAQRYKADILSIKRAQANNYFGVTSAIRDYGKDSAAQPVNRLERRILAAVNVEALSVAPPDRRTVFSTSPSAMERELTGEFQSAADEYGREQTLWASAAQETGVTELEGNARMLSRPAPQLAKIVIAVDRTGGRRNEAGIEIEALDSCGKDVVQDWKVAGEIEDRPKGLKPDPSEEPLTFTPDEIAEMNPGCLLDAGRMIPPSVLSRFAHPDKSEPLAGYVSSILLHLAIARHMSLVADVPDVYLGDDSPTAPKQLATGLFNRLWEVAPSIVHIDGDWIEVAAGAIPSGYRLGWRCDRRQLTTLLATKGLRGFEPEDLARYAAGSSHPLPDSLTSLRAHENGHLMMVQSWSALRLLGHFVPVAPGQLQTVGPVPLSRLGPDVNQLLTEIVFDQHTSLTISSSSGQVGFEPGEPSDYCPTGLPSTTLVSLKVEHHLGVFAENYPYRPISANSIAVNTFLTAHPGALGPGNRAWATTGRYRVGDHWSVSITVQLDGRASTGLTCEGDFLAGGDSVPFEGLPQEFVMESSRRLASYERAYGPGGLANPGRPATQQSGPPL